MRSVPLRSLVVCLALAGSGASVAEPAPGGSIHGTIRTTGDEVLTGTIRWGRAGFWDDTLSTRRAQVADESVEDDGFRLSLFGFTLVDTAADVRVVQRLEVPFGHLRAIEPARGSGAVLELKGGARIPVEPSGDDLGHGLAVVVTVPGRGEVELPWRRIARVEFSGGSPGSREAERLFGTVTTRTGELAGFVVWDRDEATGDEILDGEERGRERDFPLREVAAIEPAGPASARVELRSGETVTLGGTNDVNEDNRGTEIRVQGLGTIVVPWDRLVRCELRSAPPSPPYDRFDGGRRLSGTVRAADRRVLRGTITWDRDEQFSWETLDGELDGLDYRIPFSHIRSIARSDEGGSDVTLRDGRSLHLSGTNDVDSGHRGVAVTSGDGTETVLAWTDFRDVELD